MVPNIVARNPSLVISRRLEKDGEIRYVIVQRINDPDVAGEFYRFRAHIHPAGAPRTSTWSNNIVRDETGNKDDLRLSLIKFLLDKREEKWVRTGASAVTAAAETEFWRFDTL
jgi:hypothetical protein